MNSENLQKHVGKFMVIAGLDSYGPYTTRNGAIRVFNRLARTYISVALIEILLTRKDS